MRINDVIISKRITRDVVWWGFSQWYKWRWNGTHIDLGPISIYNLKRKLLWSIVAFLIIPLRWTYHTFFVTDHEL